MSQPNNTHPHDRFIRELLPHSEQSSAYLALVLRAAVARAYDMSKVRREHEYAI